MSKPKPIEMIPSEQLEHALLKLEKKILRPIKHKGVFPALRHYENLRRKINMYKYSIEILKSQSL